MREKTNALIDIGLPRDVALLPVSFTIYMNDENLIKKLKNAVTDLERLFPSANANHKPSEFPVLWSDDIFDICLNILTILKMKGCHKGNLLCMIYQRFVPCFEANKEACSRYPVLAYILIRSRHHIKSFQYMMMCSIRVVGNLPPEMSSRILNAMNNEESQKVFEDLFGTKEVLLDIDIEDVIVVEGMDPELRAWTSFGKIFISKTVITPTTMDTPENPVAFIADTLQVMFHELAMLLHKSKKNYNIDKMPNTLLIERGYSTEPAMIDPGCIATRLLWKGYLTRFGGLRRIDWPGIYKGGDVERFFLDSAALWGKMELPILFRATQQDDEDFHRGGPMWFKRNVVFCY